ncbi:MAG: hypothetical protein IMZ61_03190 [Planctomycetes bacterium]|nr:hypothetical protein [Planctomycetota bacterium]
MTDSQIIKRYEEALRRLSSSEAIYVGGCIQPELRARMRLAKRTLDSFTPIKALVRGIESELSEETRIALKLKKRP